jgi:D-hexose-6-phosphate mutarotase
MSIDMATELPDALQMYLDCRNSREDLIVYLAGFDIWNRWQDGDIEIEQLRRVIGEIDHIATLVQEDLTSEDELRQAIMNVLHEDQATMVVSIPLAKRAFALFKLRFEAPNRSPFVVQRLVLSSAA